MGQAPHAVRRPHAEPPPPASIFRFFMRLSFPMRFHGLPHTWAASPYGIAVSPYNHTPDAFPHTSQQIPIGWSSPHMVSADPPNNTARSKKLILNSTRPAGPAPQIPNQPCQANIQNLRYNPANQTPTSSSKSHMPATGGCAVTSCTYGHDHACTAMFMPLRVMCTAASTSGHASDETSVRLAQIQAPTQLTQVPCGCVTHPRIYNPTGTQNTWGAWVWHRLAMRRRRRRQRRRQRRRRQGRGRCMPA